MNRYQKTSPSFESRSEALEFVAGQLLGIAKEGILRVAVDGVDGAGKTFFANELAACLSASSREVIRASVDGFHQEKAIR